MSAESVHPWWSVHIVLVRNDENDDREFYVQAPTSAQAVMVAVGATEFSEEVPIHYIHVGRAMKRPRDDLGAFGWREPQRK